MKKRKKNEKKKKNQKRDETSVSTHKDPILERRKFFFFFLFFLFFFFFVLLFLLFVLFFVFVREGNSEYFCLSPKKTMGTATNRPVTVCLLLFSFLVWVPSSFCELPAWSGLHGDPTNSGNSLSRGPRICEHMSYGPTHGLESSPRTPFVTIGTGGNLYAATSRTELTSFSPSLKVRWKIPTKTSMLTVPVLSPSFDHSEDSVYFSDQTTVYSVPSGGPPTAWETAFFDDVAYLQISNSGGFLFVGLLGSLDSFVILSAQDGSELWNIDLSLTSTPAVSPDDSIVLAPSANGLTAFNVSEDGTASVLWRRDGLSSVSSPVISDDGLFGFWTLLDGRVLCFHMDDGDTFWTYQTGSLLNSPVSLSPINGSVFAVTQDQVFSLTSEGKKEWIYTLNSSAFITGPVTVDSDGSIWLGLTGERLVGVLDPEGHLEGVSDPFSCDACAVDPTVTSTLALSDDHSIYFILEANGTSLITIKNSSCKGSHTPIGGIVGMCVLVFVSFGFAVFFVLLPKPRSGASQRSQVHSVGQDGYSIVNG